MEEYIYEIIDEDGQLTRVQRDYLVRIAKGHTQKRMAADLHRSEETTKRNSKLLQKKFGATNGPSLIAIAVAKGLLKITVAGVTAFSIFIGVYSNNNIEARMMSRTASRSNREFSLSEAA